MPISEWPDHDPPQAYWELTRFPLHGWDVESETPIAGVPPSEMAQELVALRTRLGFATEHPDEVVMYGYDIDDEFAEFLNRYVSPQLDLSVSRYQICLIDQSGGRRRAGWGDFVEEPQPKPSGPAHSYGQSWESQPTYESGQPPQEPWGKDPWGDSD